MNGTVTTHVPDVGFRSVAWLTTGEAVEAYETTQEAAEAAVLAMRDVLNALNS